MGVAKISNSKSDLQGHWQMCHSIGHIQFPTRLSLLPCLYVAQIPTLASAFPEMIASIEIKNWSCDPDHAPFRNSLSSIG